MKILFLTRYGRQGASSRLRTYQYIPSLRSVSIEYVISPLFNDSMLMYKYQNSGYNLLDLLLAFGRRIYALLKANKFDVIWIEKEALPWFPVHLEKFLLRKARYVLDYDDAVFHNYDKHRLRWVRLLLGRRIDTLMANAKLVIAGNRYLADRAISASASRVEIMPSVVDLVRYAPKQSYNYVTKPVIVWIGSPSSIQYLLDLAAPLEVLSSRHLYTLRVIGGGSITIPGVDVVSLPWSEDTEAALISECDVGIMPLRDTPWEQGKCAYKLIQYMACGLPTVASPIGVNNEVVVEGETGFFADTPTGWLEQLDKLLSDADLRHRLGQAGRQRVESKYCLQHTATRLVHLLIEVGAK